MAMHRRVNPRRRVNGKVSGWDKIISDAELHIVRLKAAIRHARDMKITSRNRVRCNHQTISRSSNTVFKTIPINFP